MATVAGSIAALAAAGCGGSSSAEPLNRSQFVQEANSICKDTAAERADALEGAAEDQQIADLTAEALPSVEKMTEELSDLTPPAKDAKEVRAIVAAFEDGTAEVKANRSDPAAVISAYAEANELAEAYGLSDCTI